MNPLVIIPARKGSKGVPGKNTKPLNGIPLIQYTIEAARAVFEDAQICVSTDDQHIIELSRSLGLAVPFVRPGELSTDTSSTHDVILHALNHYKAIGQEIDTVVLLQPTSPFRSSKHIQEALSLYSNELDMVVSVKETHSNPYYNLFEEKENGMLKKVKEGNFTRRQDCPKVFEYNGAIYIINTRSLASNTIIEFQNVKKYVMTTMDSIDIDTAFDWKIAETVFNEAD